MTRAELTEILAVERHQPRPRAFGRPTTVASTVFTDTPEQQAQRRADLCNALTRTNHTSSANSDESPRWIRKGLIYIPDVA
jgi:hypothetical protein